MPLFRHLRRGDFEELVANIGPVHRSSHVAPRRGDGRYETFACIANNGHSRERLGGKPTVNLAIDRQAYLASKIGKIRAIQQIHVDRGQRLAALERCDRQTVWQAVLDIREVFRIDAVAQLECPGKYLDVDHRDLVMGHAVACFEIRERIDGRMDVSAARIRLEICSLDFPRLAQVADDA